MKKHSWVLVLWVLMNSGKVFCLKDGNSWTVDSASFGDVRTIDVYSGKYAFDLEAGNPNGESHKVATFLAKQVTCISREKLVSK